jgi:hypothetical protein
VDRVKIEDEREISDGAAIPGLARTDYRFHSNQHVMTNIRVTTPPPNGRRSLLAGEAERWCLQMNGVTPLHHKI